MPTAAPKAAPCETPSVEAEASGLCQHALHHRAGHGQRRAHEYRRRRARKAYAEEHRVRRGVAPAYQRAEYFVQSELYASRPRLRERRDYRQRAGYEEGQQLLSLRPS